MSLTDLSRVGWTAVVSSYYDAATTGDKALDGIDEENNSFWISDIGAPQTITIDMGSAQPFNYIKYKPGSVRFYTPVFWGQRNPALVTVYVSNDNTNWTYAGKETWPSEGRVEYVYLLPQNARYFRLTILSFDGRDYLRALLAEIYAGWWDGKGTRKMYYKARPRTYYDMSVYTDPTHNQGEISGIIVTNELATAKIKLWHTSSLVYYPEIAFTNWNLPHNWQKTPWETISIVVEGSHVRGNIFDGHLLSQKGSGQFIFDFNYAWYSVEANFSPIIAHSIYDMSSGPWDGLVTIGDVTEADLNNIYSNLFLWHSMPWTAASHDDDDCSVLNITDHYILFTYWGSPYSVFTDGARNAQHISY